MKHIFNPSDQLPQIISHIYDAALDPNQWKYVIEMMARLLNAEQGYVRIIDTNSNYVQQTYSHNKDPGWVQAYKDYYIHQDPWLNKILCSTNTLMACTHHLISNNEYEAMEFYQDFVHPQKTHYGLGGFVNIENNFIAYFAFNRSKEKQGFQDETLKNLLLLEPHIQKTLLINKKTRHIEIEKNLLSDALNHVNSPLLLVNEKGNILFVNSQAEKIIEQQTSLIIKNNHIIILSQVYNKILQQLIYQASRHKTDDSSRQGGAMNYTDPVSQTSFSILVSPINPDKANIRNQEYGSVLLLINSNNYQASLSMELLIALYKLTKAEARLTMHLCQGLTLDEISEKYSLSKNTLRSQLRSCFNKIDVSRQADLIRIVNSGAAGIVKPN